MNSMTGYGHSRRETEDYCIDCEIRSLNHRFLEISMRLPRCYSRFELDVRSLISSRFDRGKIEVTVVRKILNPSYEPLVVNQELFKSYIDAHLTLFQEIGISPSKHLAEIAFSVLEHEDVFSSNENVVRWDEELETFKSVLTDVAAQVCEMRAQEGARLSLAFENQVGQLRSIKEAIAHDGSRIPEAIRTRIIEKVSRLSPEIKIDETRLCAEVSIIAERSDISEEITRLSSHFIQLENALSQKPSGKRLEFLMQECNREFNTISSKAQDASIQKYVVDAKIVLEKMREQVQNVE